MTEPVAYRAKDEDEMAYYLTSEYPDGRWDIIQPLYTDEQLHPRVKMTQKQYDRLMWDKENTDLLNCLGYFLNSDGNHFGLSSGNFKGDLTQEGIARAWFYPEETIEIVPTMKWFARSKEKYEADIVQGLPESGYLYLTDGGSYSIEYCEMTTFKDDAAQFGTKEEAELWTNPLTEAVRLAVEEE